MTLCDICPSPPDPGVVEVGEVAVLLLLAVVAVGLEVAAAAAAERVAAPPRPLLALRPPLGEDGAEPGRRQDHEHGAEHDLPGVGVGQLGDQPLSSRWN